MAETFISNTDRFNAGNIVLISDEITPAYAAATIEKLLGIHMQGGKDTITVMVNSDGGELDSAYMLCDVVLGIGRERTVHTRCSGTAASAALLVYLTGNIRTASPQALFMAHEYTWSHANKLHEMKGRRGIEDHYGAVMKKYIRDRAGAKAAALLDRKTDQWLTATQAVKLGIVHKIMTGPKLFRGVKEHE